MGDLLLDFVDPATGMAADTVVIAGENGCGKTAVLSDIFASLSGGRPVSNYEMQLDLTGEDQEKFRTYYGAARFKQSRVTLMSRGDEWGHDRTTARVRFSTDDLEEVVRDYPEPDPALRQIMSPFRVFYDEVAIGYNEVRVTSVNFSDVDHPGISGGKSGGAELAQRFGQLLVDIRHADNEDLAIWSEKNPGKAVPLEIRRRRMARFDDAIEYMLPNKRLHSIERDGDILQGFVIRFGDGDRLASLNQLSSGEKQIILRGGFLLTHQRSVLGSIVLVDEPELGLHPAWQARILGYYRKLIPDVKHETTQLIVATHSPFVVHDTKATKVIILQQDRATGTVGIVREPTYPSTGQERLVSAFNVRHLLTGSDKDVVVLVEGETDQRILNTAWEKLHPGQTCPYDFRNALNYHNIRTTMAERESFRKNPTKKIVGVFDFDSAFEGWDRLWAKNSHECEGNEARGLTKKHPEYDGWAILLPVPDFRPTLAKIAYGSTSRLSIELLFKEADDYQGLLSHKEAMGGFMAPVVNDKKKVEFSKHVATLPRGSFDAFIPLFDRLNEVLEYTSPPAP